MVEYVSRRWQETDTSLRAEARRGAHRTVETLERKAQDA